MNRCAHKNVNNTFATHVEKQYPRLSLSFNYFSPVISYFWTKFLSTLATTSSSSVRSFDKERKILNSERRFESKILKEAFLIRSIGDESMTIYLGKDQRFWEGECGRRLHGWPPVHFLHFPPLWLTNGSRVGQSVQLDSVNRYQWSQKGAALRNSSTTTLQIVCLR